MENNSKYYLKSWHIGFEVPFLDLEDPTGLTELSNKVTNRYLDWFDCQMVELTVKELKNQNQLVLFSIVVKVDPNLADSSSLIDEWNKMKEDLEEICIDFLKTRNLIYKIIRHE